MAEVNKVLNQEDRVKEALILEEEDEVQCDVVSPSPDLLTGAIENEISRRGCTEIELVSSPIVESAKPIEEKPIELQFSPHEIEKLLMNGCNLKSDDITCLMAESVPSSESEDNFGSYNYLSLMSDEKVKSRSKTCPEENDLISDLDENLQVRQTSCLPRKLSESTMQAWMADESDDCSYDPIIAGNEPLINPPSDESDMEEFIEITQVEGNEQKQPGEGKANVDLICFSENSCGDSENNQVKFLPKLENESIFTCSHKKTEETKKLLAEIETEHLKDRLGKLMKNGETTDLCTNSTDHENIQVKDMELNTDNQRRKDAEIICSDAEISSSDSEENCSEDELRDCSENMENDYATLNSFEDFSKNADERETHENSETVLRCTLQKNTEDEIAIEIEEESKSEHENVKECQKGNESDAKLKTDCQIAGHLRLKKRFVEKLFEPRDKEIKMLAIRDQDQHSDEVRKSKPFNISFEKCFLIRTNNTELPGDKNFPSVVLREQIASFTKLHKPDEESAFQNNPGLKTAECTNDSLNDIAETTTPVQDIFHDDQEKIQKKDKEAQKFNQSLVFSEGKRRNYKVSLRDYQEIGSEISKHIQANRTNYLGNDSKDSNKSPNICKEGFPKDAETINNAVQQDDDKKDVTIRRIVEKNGDKETNNHKNEAPKNLKTNTNSLDNDTYINEPISSPKSSYESRHDLNSVSIFSKASNKHTFNETFESQQTQPEKETNQYTKKGSTENSPKPGKLLEGKKIKKIKSILRSNSTTLKHVSFIEQEDGKKGDHEIEVKRKEAESEISKPREMDSDLATSLRFLTEVYPQRDEVDTLSDIPLMESSPIARTRKDSPSTAQVYEELKQLQGEKHVFEPEQLDSQKSPDETDLNQDKTQSEDKKETSKISRFFKSFRNKLAKKT